MCRESNSQLVVNLGLTALVGYRLVTSRGNSLELFLLVVVLAANYLMHSTTMVQRILAKFIRNRQTLTPEKQAAASFMSAMVNYRQNVDRYYLTRKKKLFFMLDPGQQKLAIKTYRRYKEIEDLADRNQEFLNSVVNFGKTQYDLSTRDITTADPSSMYEVTELLNHFVRDWSKDSKQREMLFEPIWKALETHNASGDGCAYGDNGANGRKMLVPGSGLCRLAADAAQYSDYHVDAVEFSPSMILGSNFALSSPSNVQISPYLTTFSHWRNANDQLEPVELEFAKRFPENLNLHYGNFLTDPGMKPNSYDAIVTLFFLDTAQNVFDYIERIRTLLKSTPKGVWINYGPIKWGSAAFAETSVDELLEYITQMGFKIESTWDGADRYDGSLQSMLDTKYRIVGWSATLN